MAPGADQPYEVVAISNAARHLGALVRKKDGMSIERVVGANA